MAIRYVRADITSLDVDAIVNSANPSPTVGGGVDSAIYEAVGIERLLKERKKIGPLAPGDAAVTPGFDLCKVVIHAVGPSWIDGKHGEFEDLRSCYRKSLQLVLEQQCRSVAFPLISTGVYGFPKAEALKIATDEINAFLLEHSKIEVILCIFDEDSFVLSGKIAETVKEFIDKEKAHEKLKEEYGYYYDRVMEKGRHSKYDKVSAPKASSYHYDLSEDDRSLAQMLKDRVEKSGEKSSAIYERAWLPRRTYSRMINGRRISKDALIAMCLALKLDLDGSADLLSRNGLAFDPSDRYDRLIVQCIKDRQFDLDKINQALTAIGLEDRLFLDRRD